MIAECSRCGAPLDVKGGARTAKCGYCGSTNRVRSMRTLAAQSPTGWQQPQTWTPPEHFPAQSVPLQYTPQQSSRARTLVFVIMGFVLVLGILPAIIVPIVINSATESVERTITISQGGTVESTQFEHIEGMERLEDLNVAFGGGGPANQPIQCSSGSVVRMNQQIDVASGPAVIASGGCQVRLMNCTVRGAEGLQLSDDAELDMVNGTLDVSGTAVTASGGATVRLTNVSVTGQEGVIASGGAEITVINGTLRTEGKAIQARGNADVSNGTACAAFSTATSGSPSAQLTSSAMSA